MLAPASTRTGLTCCSALPKKSTLRSIRSNSRSVCDGPSKMRSRSLIAPPCRPSTPHFASAASPQTRLTSDGNLPLRDSSASLAFPPLQRRPLAIQSQPPSRRSNTSRGTLFEIACQKALSAHNFELLRIGGRNDKGIDLAGWWYSSSPSADASRLRVHVQCKTLREPVSPAHIREFEGMLTRSKAPSSSTPLVGLFCSTSGFSSMAKRQVLNNADQPIMLLTFSIPDREGTSLVHHVISNSNFKQIAKAFKVNVPFSKDLEQGHFVSERTT